MSTRFHDLLALAVLAGSAHADVIVVDPGGGPGGALLNATIAQAQPGDILLLKAGDYTDADIVAGNVALVADGAGQPVLLRSLTLVVPAGPGALARGLHVDVPTSGQQSANAIVLNGELLQDSVAWIEDCTAIGGPADPPGPLPVYSGDGLRANSISHLVVVRCSLTGGDGIDEQMPLEPPKAGGDGLSITVCTAAVHECALTGGDGGDGAPGTYPANGGAGARMLFSTTSFMDCTAQGGDEGADNGFAAKPGPGMDLQVAPTDVRDTTITAGQVVGEGTPSADVTLSGFNTVIVPFAAAARGLSVPAPLREGQSSVASVHGELGDAVFVFVSPEAWVTNLPAKQGSLVLLDPLPLTVPLGVIADPSGVLEVAFHVPPLPAAQDGQILYLQSAMLTAAGETVTGSGSAFVWIDAAF